MEPFMRLFYLVFTMMSLTALMAVAAPKPKEKDKSEDPPTEEEWKLSQNRLKELGLAFHNYHDTFGFFPHDIRDKDGKALLSWRVAILPFIEEENVYKQFKLDESWDSENNKKLIEQLPQIYAPIRGKAEKYHTFYQSFSGDGAFMDPKKNLKIGNIVDGCSNTLMVVEANKPIIWSKPDDIPFDPKKELPKLGGMFLGDFNALLADGSVRKIKKSITPDTLKKLIMIADGMAVTIDD
jgi:hypothetical protein